MEFWLERYTLVGLRGVQALNIKGVGFQRFRFQGLGHPSLSIGFGCTFFNSAASIECPIEQLPLVPWPS